MGSSISRSNIFQIKENIVNKFLGLSTKAMLFFALVGPSLGQAKVFTMPNQGHGEITLTNSPCVAYRSNDKYSKKAYTWTDASYQEGCWTISDNNVVINWLNPENGSLIKRVYRASSFSVKEDIKELYPEDQDDQGSRESLW